MNILGIIILGRRNPQSYLHSDAPVLFYYFFLVPEAVKYTLYILLDNEKKKMHKLISFRIDVHIFQFF